MRSCHELNGAGVEVIIDRVQAWIAGPASRPTPVPAALGPIATWRQRLRSEIGIDTPRLAEAGGGFLVDGAGLAPIGPRMRAARPSIERRSVAILAADVAGYSRLIELDALDTALRVRHLGRYVIEPAAVANRGRVIDLAGDGALMAFPTAVNAVECAVAIQRELNALERDTPADRRIRLRMGVSADDVLVIDGDLYGRALNVAARLEALAAPGDVYLSETVFEQVSGLIPVRCEPLGARRLRNIAEPVRIYRIAGGELAG